MLQALLDADSVKVPAQLRADAAGAIQSSSGRIDILHHAVRDTRARSMPLCYACCRDRVKGVTRFSSPDDPQAGIVNGSVDTARQNNVNGAQQPCRSCKGKACLLFESSACLWAAYIHVEGRPQWGRLHASAAQARADRKVLLQARRQGSLQAAMQGFGADVG